MSMLLSKPANIIIFNLLWLGCVAGRDQFQFVVAPAVLLYIALLLHFKIVRIEFILVPAVVGIALDSTLALSGIFTFVEASVLPIPLWLVTLWFAFATALNLSLRLLIRNVWIAAVVGALGVPFNYAVGERFGAVSFEFGLIATTVILATIWGIGLPLMHQFIETRSRQLHEAL